MEYMSISQAAEKWGISPRRIQVLCKQERIPGASRMGYVWAIPVDEERQRSVLTGLFRQMRRSRRMGESAADVMSRK